MNRNPIHSRRLLATLVALTAAGVAHADLGYEVKNLVANKAEFKPAIVDPKMLNAWGIALRPPGAGGHLWISNAKSGTSSEFIGDVNGEPLHQDPLKIVSLDTPRWTDHGFAFVTGQSYNSASDLKGQPEEFHVEGPAHNLKATPPEVIKGGFNGAAKFAFVTEDGCINAWSSKTALSMDTAPLIIDYSKTSKGPLPYPVNCVFTGCAFTTHPADSPAYKKAGGNHLFVTDMRNNAIFVFDNTWKDVTKDWHFQTPASVGNLHPFNIVAAGDRLFVAYVQFNPDSDEGQEHLIGEGLGHIVEYAEDGTLIRDYNDHGLLNAPWGMAIAPATFGKFANHLLVANFGDGTVMAFDLATGELKGYLRAPDTTILTVDGIWGLAFGNGVSLGDANVLYFTAGPNNEEDGVFGRISPVSLLPKQVPPKAVVSKN